VGVDLGNQSRCELVLRYCNSEPCSSLLDFHDSVKITSLPNKDKTHDI
jgi:hypothetical protein